MEDKTKGHYGRKAAFYFVKDIGIQQWVYCDILCQVTRYVNACGI